MINDGNKTEWSPIRSVIIRMISKMGLEDTKFYYRFYYQFIITITKFEKNVGKAKPVEYLLRFVITVMKSDFQADFKRDKEENRSPGAHNSNSVIGQFVIGQFVIRHLSCVRSNSAKNIACQEPIRFQNFFL